MNENPRRGTAPGTPKVSGDPEKFRLNIAEEDMATGTLNVPKRRPA